MDQDWVWSGLVQPLKDPILLDLIGYQTRPDPIRSDSVGGPISISGGQLQCDTRLLLAISPASHGLHTLQHPLHPGPAPPPLQYDDSGTARPGLPSRASSHIHPSQPSAVRLSRAVRLVARTPRRAPQ